MEAERCGTCGGALDGDGMYGYYCSLCGCEYGSDAWYGAS